MTIKKPNFFKKPERKKASRIEASQKTSVFGKLFLKPVHFQVFISIIISAFAASLIVPKQSIPTFNYQPGDIARQDIRAPKDFSIEDKELTEQRRSEKADSILSVYDFNSRAAEETEKRVVGAFEFMRETKSENPDMFNDISQCLEHRDVFQKLLKTQINDNDFELLCRRGFKKEIENFILDLILPFTQREIASSRELLFKERGRGIILRDIYSQEEILLEDISQIIDIKDSNLQLKREARRILQNVRIDVQATIVSICLKLIEPNVKFNKIETNKRKTGAVDEVSPLYYPVREGEIIVREGTKITDITMLKLNALSELTNERGFIIPFLGYLLLIFVSINILYSFTTMSLKTKPQSKLYTRDILFLASIIIIGFLFIKFSFASADVFSKAYPGITPNTFLYVIPFAFTAIVISIVLSPQIAAICSIIIGLYSCFLADSQFNTFIFSVVGSFIGSIEASKVKERKTIFRAGLVVGLANIVIIICLSLMEGRFAQTEILLSIAFGMLGGILSAILATGLIPAVEILFNYTTNIKLLELADMNQPVLRNLLISAPGTYHHSILVGILAESAAESISAHPLLTRVCSYYHDIGKIKKPLYFVENQKAGENRHDKLLPTMSSLIIVSHVKDGVEIAKKNRLGKTIQDIISQHHGTSLINFFYQKAKELSSTRANIVNDKDFRYPGPKPQTKEAGIIMLADAVQAASKTLSEPTPARIKGLVQKIINAIYEDGQLDECELTLKDLHLIAENFVRILNGFFHSRIEYPDKQEKDKNDNSTDRKPPKIPQGQNPHDSINGEGNNKRIGVRKIRDKHSVAG